MMLHSPIACSQVRVLLQPNGQYKYDLHATMRCVFAKKHAGDALPELQLLQFVEGPTPFHQSKTVRRNARDEASRPTHATHH